MTENTADVVVVGGGVIGCAVAYYASKAGLRVTVLDAPKIGGQGSSIAAGLVAPSPQIKSDGPFTRLALASLAVLPQLRDELREDTGIDIELDHRGTLRLAATEDEARELQELLPIQRQLGLNLQWLSATEVKQMEPGVTEKISGAVYSPEEGQLTTSNLLAGYREGAKRHGAIFLRRKATRPLFHDAKVAGVQLGQERMYAPQTIIAAGAWTPKLERWLAVEIPIRPQRGQLVILGEIEPKLEHILFWKDMYLSPKCDGTITLGAANDYVGYVHMPSAGGTLTLLSQGRECEPAIDMADFIKAQVGLRPRTPDKLPIIGNIPGREGIKIAAGHNSNGLLFSAVTGQIIAAQLTGSSEPLDSKPYRLERFTRSN